MMLLLFGWENLIAFFMSVSKGSAVWSFQSRRLESHYHHGCTKVTQSQVSDLVVGSRGVSQPMIHAAEVATVSTYTDFLAINVCCVSYWVYTVHHISTSRKK
jgi:hypothetical protein